MGSSQSEHAPPPSSLCALDVPMLGVIRKHFHKGRILPLAAFFTQLLHRRMWGWRWRDTCPKRAGPTSMVRDTMSASSILLALELAWKPSTLLRIEGCFRFSFVRCRDRTLRKQKRSPTCHVGFSFLQACDVELGIEEARVLCYVST